MMDDSQILMNDLKKDDYYRYLCCLLLPDNFRKKALVIYSFNNEISKIKDMISEPMAGHVRLQWWRDTLDRIYAPEHADQQHITARMMQDLISENNIDKKMFGQLIDARELDIDFVPPKDLEALNNYAVTTSSDLFSLLLKACDISDERSFEAGKFAGIAYALTGLLRSTSFNASKNRVYLPQDLLDKQKVTVDDVVAGRKQEEIRVVVRAICDKIDVNYHHFKSLSIDLPSEVLSLFLPVYIVPVFLKRIRKYEYDVFNHDLELPRFPLQWSIFSSSFSLIRK